jgi:methylmalonyl-CoA mutase N-terminal domain/subunit
VNKFTVPSDEPYQLLPVNPALEQEQARRLATLRSERDTDEFRRRLDDLKKAATGGQNMLVPLREALRHRATVGEVCDTLREVWGTYQPPDLD